MAAERLRLEGHATVALLDVDYHHGNGTQAIFFERPDVRVCSLHADPEHAFPYFTGHADETGSGAGIGHNRNLPLPRGTTGSEWLAALDHGIEWLGEVAPTALVVSLGLDTAAEDPISGFELARADFTRLGRRLAMVGLPTVLVLEGGYATETLGTNLVAVLEGFAPARR